MTDGRAYVVDIFQQRIFPVLTPLAVDPAHPFPYISNLALSLAAMVCDPDTGERRFARLKVPSILPRLMALPGGDRQTEFSVGTLGLWDDRDFVIYYRAGQVPPPGIVVLGHVRGDLSLFDNPGGVTISLRQAD
jgi:hypothetical protein